MRRLVLGPILSNFSKSNLENKIFNKIKRISVYLKYILILANDAYKINILKDIFPPKKSALNFTHELNKNIKISFLDVLIETNNNYNSFINLQKPHE